MAERKYTKALEEIRPRPGGSIGSPRAAPWVEGQISGKWDEAVDVLGRSAFKPKYADQMRAAARFVMRTAPARPSAPRAS